MGRLVQKFDEGGAMKEGEIGKVFHDGEIIFREGDTGDVMYVIQSGKVKITRNSPKGDVILGELAAGEIFGEMALFDRLPRCANAIASGDARILSVDKKKLFPTISKDPTLLFKILETMSQRIRRLDDEITKLKKHLVGQPASSANILETCSLLLEEARSVIPADSGSVMLMDEEERRLTIKAAFGAESDSKIRLKPGEGIAGNVLSTGRPEMINNVSLDSRYLPGVAKIVSLICVPIGSDGHNFGVINMSSASEKGFTLDHLKMLRTLAIYASIAIQNAQNFSHLKNAANELLKHATLFNSGCRISDI